MANIRICSIDGCGNEHKARGLCNAHYHRMKYHGTPTAGRAAVGRPMEWLRAHINHQDDECLIWPFARMGDGTAEVRYHKKGTHAARVMCILAHGQPTTSRLHAAHNCGKGHMGCVNPKHLRWATVVENHADKVCHGTAQRGEKQWAARLTRDDVRQIRRLSISMSHQDIADLFGIDQSHATNIINRKAWAWLP